MRDFVIHNAARVLPSQFIFAMRWLTIIPAGFTLCGLAYYAISLWSTRRFLEQRRAPPGKSFSPPVSILKPVRGAPAGSYEAFASHCAQYYPEYEIIFGVHVPDDPAVALIERLQSEFPLQSIRVLVCTEVLGASPKVSNLLQMLREARHPHVLINDDDIRVPPDYLRRVMSNFIYSKVGMVTTLYRGAGAHTLGARLEALGIASDFAAGVLTARHLEGGLNFALGATMALSPKALELVGGLEPVADYLADDYELGKRVACGGLDVVLSDLVVETQVHPYTMAGYLRHQLRWGRTMRNSRKAGYAGLGLTYAIPWAIITLLAAHGAWWAWLWLALITAARLYQAWIMVAEVVEDKNTLKSLWLAPLRDCLAIVVWMASFAGNTIHWRDQTFTLRDGKLSREGSS